MRNESTPTANQAYWRSDRSPFRRQPPVRWSSYDRDVVATAAAAFRDSETAVAVTTASRSAEQSIILWVNAAFVRLTGYSAEEAIGRASTILGGARRDILHLGEVELLHDHPENMPFGIVATKDRRDGTSYDVEEHITPIRGPASRTTHYLVCQTELTWGSARRAEERNAEAA